VKLRGVHLISWTTRCTNWSGAETNDRLRRRRRVVAWLRSCRRPASISWPLCIQCHSRTSGARPARLIVHRCWRLAVLPHQLLLLLQYGDSARCSAAALVCDARSRRLLRQAQTQYGTYLGNPTQLDDESTTIRPKKKYCLPPVAVRS